MILLYNSLENENRPIVTESRSMVFLGQSENGWWVRKGQVAKVLKKTSGKMNIFIILFAVIFSQACTYIKTHHIKHFKYIQFIALLGQWQNMSSKCISITSMLNFLISRIVLWGLPWWCSG